MKSGGGSHWKAWPHALGAGWWPRSGCQSVAVYVSFEVCCGGSMVGSVQSSVVQVQWCFTRRYQSVFMEPDKWQEDRCLSLFVVCIFFQLLRVLSLLWASCLSFTKRHLHFDLQRAALELAVLLDFAGSSVNDMHHCIKELFEWKFFACTPYLRHIAL